eukprot:5989635-Pyramimonas_sp.AAC.2
MLQARPAILLDLVGSVRTCGHTGRSGTPICFRLIRELRVSFHYGVFLSEQAGTAAECVAASDITIAMLSDPAAASAVVFGPNGVLGAIDSTKSYVDMSTVDAGTSEEINKVRGRVSASQRFGFREGIPGRHLKQGCVAGNYGCGRSFLGGAGVWQQGSSNPGYSLESYCFAAWWMSLNRRNIYVCVTPNRLGAGQLVILAAGDESLYKACEVAFDAMGKKAFYLGICGAGAKMKLVVNMVMGSMMVHIAVNSSSIEVSPMDRCICRGHGVGRCGRLEPNRSIGDAIPLTSHLDTFLYFTSADLTSSSAEVFYKFSSLYLAHSSPKLWWQVNACVFIGRALCQWNTVRGDTRFGNSLRDMYSDTHRSCICRAYALFPCAT